MKPFSTPIFIAGFNRPECLREVIGAVMEVNPRHLFFTLDAPRLHVPADEAGCREVRKLVESVRIRDCEITIDLAPANMGCGRRLSSGLTAFFNKYDRGIILEDDTIPAPAFFHFCENALTRYASASDIGHISGSRFEGRAIGNFPHRSVHPHIWGWATWARCWRAYDFAMGYYSNRTMRNQAEAFVDDSFIWNRWLDSFERIRFHRIDTWDYQWTFTCWRNGWSAVTPPVNLVRNVGFGASATHTKGDERRLSLPISVGQIPVDWSNLLPRQRELDRKVQLLRYGFMPNHSDFRRFVRRLWWTANISP